MQWIPVSPTETVIREIAYVHPDARREMRAARYLNWRINRQVNAEDKALIERVQAGMASRSYYRAARSARPSRACAASPGACAPLIPESRSPRAAGAGWAWLA